jgi:hypothetical protein
MRQDAALCEQIMVMRSFAELSSAEKHNPKALSEEQRRFVLQLEKDAGLILQGK